MNLVSRDTRTARLALRDLKPGVAVHGISDGSWSKIDAIREMLRRLGPSRLTVSTWTAAAADMVEAERLLRSKLITDFRLLVDRSFPTRQPRYAAAAIKQFGNDAMRIWNSHAKFVICQGQENCILYLTSANLNKNKRVENFSAFMDEEIADQYMAMIDDVYERQVAGLGKNAFAQSTYITDQVTANVGRVA